MDIREQIGNRITKARKELGITIKELAARTAELSPARISNWEQGTRSPGPLEAKLLADQLNVSASYLLCLTDNPQGDLIQNPENKFRHILILSMKEAPHAREILGQQEPFIFEKTILVDSLNPSIKSSALFATSVDDSSMQPELNPGDVVVIDGDLQPNPGRYVLVYLTQKKQTVLRRYGEADGCHFQLLASSDLWATVSIKDAHEAQIIGVVVEIRKYLR
ncbi:TPA: LexA family transcriptional regulator [Legionella pneumophila]|uniref:LexA family transcriptional regulator n=1 Tax=Legionella pneumophila TaxID=446 RepID=UPI0008633D62|nr:LexA family transcriptional regulator [Legionella pneumophila]HAT8876814.1 helix-turn-helix domain-containing protein [Legionella pneumophila subsp. pneumophila]AOU08006.1 XRE family transcriptional regulator [Legionella pneumophila]HAT8878973.1 helix-turn-helix domain-containing protein [Legionella pneumophila subsp. pneumophila]HAU0998023.1 LexA family transcriptional regulator [Legionella pneumophila]HAU1000959.1 LexA family transcriptional regulator [Legionella pneumophila]